MTEEDKKELRERLALITSLVKSAELAFDGACRTGDLNNTRHFAFAISEAASILGETIDMIVEMK